jgi:hypothetical protein
MNRGVCLWFAIAEVAAFTAAAAAAFALFFAFVDPQDGQNDGDADGREDQDIREIHWRPPLYGLTPHQSGKA